MTIYYIIIGLFVYIPVVIIIWWLGPPWYVSRILPQETERAPDQLKVLEAISSVRQSVAQLASVFAIVFTIAFGIMQYTSQLEKAKRDYVFQALIKGLEASENPRNIASAIQAVIFFRIVVESEYEDMVCASQEPLNSFIDQMNKPDSTESKEAKKLLEKVEKQCKKKERGHP